MLTKIVMMIMRFLFMVIAVMGAIALGAYIAFLTYQTIFYIQNVTVPSVVNMELDEARETIYQSGLKMKVIDDHVFREGDKFYVISQNPSPGDEIKKNRTVEIGIRETKSSQQVPNLVGKTIEEAEQILSEYEYQIGNIAYSMHQDLPKGTIIAQTPTPGENTQTNGEINILVSKGLY
ncbi:MAG: PASTA domain-containing protein [Elusimicrobiota bacterium]